MKLTILGSSSSGNCYVLHADSGQTLIIECGVAMKKIKAAIDYDVSHCAGILVTHEHGDHAGHVNQALKTSIPVFMSRGTADTIQEKGLTGTFDPKIVEHGKVYKIGEFRVLPFDVKHDAAEPFGYLIDHPESGKILFATDTYFLPMRFKDLSNIMIECNYRRDILDHNIDEGRIPLKLRNRIIESHMEFDECVRALKANDITGVVNILLIHLSDSNADAATFKSEIEKITGKNVIIATPGTTIEFNKNPF